MCVCVCVALGLLQPGALTGLSHPEAVQPVSRMAGGIPGPEAPRAGPAGAGRTGGGSLADPLHLVLSIFPQAPRSQQAPSWRNLSCFIFEGCGFRLLWQWVFRARLQGIRQLWRCLGLLVTAEGQASVAEPLAQECLWAPLHPSALMTIPPSGRECGEGLPPQLSLCGQRRKGATSRIPERQLSPTATCADREPVRVQIPAQPPAGSVILSRLPSNLPVPWHLNLRKRLMLLTGE